MTTTTAEKNFTIPHRFSPRKYQLNMMGAIPSGYKRYVGIWHRRAGKDKTAFNFVVSQAIQKKAVYYYFFPTYRQGRKVLWEGIDPRTGLKYTDHIPLTLIAKKNDSEMKIELVNGSLIQVVGTDNWDSVMGTPPLGCVFSEYSLQDPRAWDYIRPILRENDGWAIFIYTPRGRNHGYTLFKMAVKSADWYVEKLTVNDTRRDDGTAVITDADIDKDRSEGMDEDLIQQEYYCSFEGAVVGAYFSKQLQQSRKDGRITRVPYVPGIPVDTYWDLGMDDSTTIWFIQSLHTKEIRVIDFIEDSGEGIAHYAKILKEKPYVYGEHFFPHDVEVRELGTGKSRKEVAENYGIKPLTTIERPRDSEAVNAGIEAGRNFLSRCYFDDQKCQRGLEALESYHKEYDEENKVFRNRPMHDWSSHAADAFRTFAMGFKERLRIQKTKPKPKKHWMAA